MITSNRYYSAIAALLLLWAGAAAARPSPERIAALQRGINITHWFRFPPSVSPAALTNYLSDRDLERLRRSGFTFLRIPVEPQIARAAPDALIRAIRRIQRQGLAVVITLAPQTWHLEDNEADSNALIAFWQNIAPRLASLPPDRTFPEILNEPVFPNDPAQWNTLQHRALAVIRDALPNDTIILTGNDWSSAKALLSLPPLADPNVAYTFHFYDPVELTSLAAWNPRVDHAALTGLPFPISNPASCTAALSGTNNETAGTWRFYCASRWDQAAIAATFQKLADWAQQNDAFILLGEFGATDRLNAASRLAWLAAVHTAAAEAHFGWALWGYDDVMGFDCRPSAACPNSAVLQALSLRQQ